MSAILLFISVLPSIVLGFYIYKKDKVEPEPKGLLAMLFFFGVLSIIPAIILELILAGVLSWVGISEEGNLISIFLYCVIGIAAVEEGCKWVILKLGTWNNKEFNHIFDAIVYAVFTSLGFATLENILYVFQNGLGTGIMRAILSVPGHAFFGVYMGYYYGIAKQCNLNGNGKLYGDNILKSFLIPTLIHGLFDFLLSTGYEVVFLVYLGLVIFLYVTAFMKVRKFSNIMTNLQIPYSAQVVQTMTRIPVNQIIAEQQKIESAVGNLQPITVPYQYQQQGAPQPVMPLQQAMPAQQPMPAQQQVPIQQAMPAQPINPMQQPLLSQPVQPIQPVQQAQPVQPAMNNMRVCEKCGNPINAGAVFCTKCGSKLQ